MKKFIQNFKDIWAIEELRNKILLTLGLLAVYRLGAHITLPGIDATQLSGLSNKAGGNGLLGVLNMFTGGAFARASIMALGVMPYISASIVVQLMGIAIPYLQKLKNEGESGNKKITQITRWLTIVILVVQAPTYLVSLRSLGVPESAFLLHGFNFWFSSILLLTTGTVFAMWLGERITEKGIGNGISLLIMIGIMARLPQSFMQEIASKLKSGNGGLMMMMIEIIVWLFVIMAAIFLVTAIRKIAVKYARRTVAGTIGSLDGARDYIPLKLNSAGVMPIIFAQAIMFVPALLQKSDNETIKSIGLEFTNMFGLWYNVLFAFLIIIFGYFYTAITIPTNKMADDLKRGGGFIPGFKPGSETAEFLDTILSRITLPGSLFLAALAVLPAFIVKFGVQSGWAMFFGGTSLIIMVGVVMDTIQQIESHLLNRHYDGLMKEGNKRKSIKK